MTFAKEFDCLIVSDLIEPELRVFLSIANEDVLDKGEKKLTKKEKGGGRANRKVRSVSRGCVSSSRRYVVTHGVYVVPRDEKSSPG